LLVSWRMASIPRIITFVGLAALVGTNCKSTSNDRVIKTSKVGETRCTDFDAPAASVPQSQRSAPALMAQPSFEPAATDPHERGQGERAAFRRRPRAALAPAARRLALGDHDRAVRRSGDRKLPRAVVRGSDHVEMDERPAQPPGARPQWSSAGCRTNSASAPTPSAPAALPWFTAIATRPEESSRITAWPGPTSANVRP